MYIVNEHTAADMADGLYARPCHPGVVQPVHQLPREGLGYHVVALEPRGVRVRDVVGNYVQAVHLRGHTQTRRVQTS
jgi:hypothetical protein